MHIKNLSVSVGTTPILSNISMEMPVGSIQGIMGPNGSGKSTLARVLMGDEAFTITAGTISWQGEDLCALTCDERARRGLFLAHQQPPAIPGLALRALLKESYSRIHGPIELKAFTELLQKTCGLVGLDPSFLNRSVNDGLSGGEKKRCELLQLAVLRPRCVILDEIDSGLDLDGLKMIGAVISYIREKTPDCAVLIISHNPQLFKLVIPQQIHILAGGTIRSTIAPTLVHQVEQHGYQQYDL